MEIKEESLTQYCNCCGEVIPEDTPRLLERGVKLNTVICMKCAERIHDVFEHHHQEQQLELDLE